MAEHDEVDAAALHDTLESVQKQLKLLTLKEALVRDSVQDDVEGFEALKAKVEQIEAENREFLEDAVRRKEKATGPQVMASMRRPAAMPFRQDTDLHGFQQTIKYIGKEEQEQLEAEADEDYARAAEQLAEVLESGSGAAAALTNDEKKLLASINSMKRSLAAQNDERAGQNEHKRAEEQLAAMLSQVIPPVLSLFTLFRPYLAHFFAIFPRFLRVFTVSMRRFQRAPVRNPGPRNSGARAKSGELRPSFDTAGAGGRITWCGRRSSCPRPWSGGAAAARGR